MEKERENLAIPADWEATEKAKKIWSGWMRPICTIFSMRAIHAWASESTTYSHIANMSLESAVGVMTGVMAGVGEGAAKAANAEPVFLGAGPSECGVDNGEKAETALGGGVESRVIGVSMEPGSGRVALSKGAGTETGGRLSNLAERTP